MTLHFSLAFEEVAKSPGSRLLRLVYKVYLVFVYVFVLPYSDALTRERTGNDSDL